jgi:hypothetical protein
VRSVQEEVKSGCLLLLEGCRGRLGELAVKGGRGLLQADPRRAFFPPPAPPLLYLVICSSRGVGERESLNGR